MLFSLLQVKNILRSCPLGATAAGFWYLDPKDYKAVKCDEKGQPIVPERTAPVNGAFTLQDCTFIGKGELPLLRVAIVKIEKPKSEVAPM